MSITNQTVEDVFSGNGLTTVFASDVVAFEVSQIEVYLREDDVDTLQTLTTHYTVSGLKPTASLAEDDAGVTITFITPPTADQQVVIARTTPVTQQLELTSTRAYNPEVLMYQLDRTVMMMQELARETARSFKVAPGLDEPLPVLDGAALANLLSYATQAAASAAAAAVSAAAALAAENTLIEPKGAWVTATAYAPSDIVRQGTAQYICLIAHTSGTFSTDLGAGRWEVWLLDGAAGPGSGDLLSEQNLADLADADAAVINLGFSVLGAARRDQGGVSTHTAGTNAQGQGALAANVSFAYCAAVSSLSGVTLPATVDSRHGWGCTIINPATSTAGINVYPASGEAFSGLSANAAVLVPPGYHLNVWQRQDDEWAYSIIKAVGFDDPIAAQVVFNGTFQNGTYSRTDTLITVTMTAHALTTGHQVQLDFTTGTATDGHYVVTVIDANTFTVTDTASGATSGNVTRLTTIMSSRGIASVARNTTGDYTITYTEARPSTHYVWQMSCGKPFDTSWVYWAQPRSAADILAGSMRIRTGYVSGTASGGYNAIVDLERVTLTVFKD
ncbi:MAG: hypothetical protein HC888_01480 [Candidatus Competibacteraceae bacterium]|nr:hypothetical protein [Candidatus Competibacteraceae bacterium]